jgi:3-oxoacyl-[acyl-carrier-protein] synthase-3
MPLDKFVINVEHYGNTSTASIPIATVEAIQKGQIKAKDKIAFVGFGGGLTWGAMIVEWTGPLPAKKHVHPEQYRLFARLRSFVRRAIRFIEGFLSRKEV